MRYMNTDSAFISQRGLKRRDAWCGVFLYDYPSAPLARILASRGVSANLITSLSMVLSTVGLVAVTLGFFQFTLVLISLAVLFDCTDGKIARISSKASQKGAHLDKVADIILHGLLPLVLGARYLVNEQYYAAALMFLLSIILGRALLKGILGMGPALEPPQNSFLWQKWDKWCENRRLVTEPVAETELAFMLPPAVIIEVLLGWPNIVSSVILASFTIFKAVKVLIFKLQRIG